MAREYEIRSIEDFNAMVKGIMRAFDEDGFTPLRVVAKKLVKSKTPESHRKYFAVIAELKQALYESGTIMNTEEVHELIKQEAGFTRCIDVPGEHRIVEVTKSIKNASEDCDIEVMCELISFVKSWAIDKLNYHIE